MPTILLALLGSSLVLVAFGESSGWSDTNPCRSVAVVGGTGTQGQAVISELLAPTLQTAQQYPDYHTTHGTVSRVEPWRIRTITRNKSSPTALDLAARGVEVLQGSLQDVNVIESLFSGVCAAFLVTFTDFEHNSEYRTGQLLADAARAAGVESIIFSSGPPTGVDFLDIKNNIEAYIASLGFPYQIFLHSGFYYDNLIIKGGQPRLHCQQSGSMYEVTLSSPFPEYLPCIMHAASSIGKTGQNVMLYCLTHLCAAAVLLENRVLPTNSTVPIVGSRVTPAEYAETLNVLAAQLGLPIRAKYTQMSLEALTELIPGRTGVRIAEMYRRYLDGTLDWLNSQERLAKARTFWNLPVLLPDWLQSYGLEQVLGICSKD